MATKIVEIEETPEVSSETQKVTVTVARLGGATLVKEYQQGTTIADIRADINAVGLEVRVNKAAVKEGYVLKDNDLIVIVPEAIVGGH